MTDLNLSDLNRLNAEHTNNLKSRYFKALDDYFAGHSELLAKHAKAGTSIVLDIPKEILLAVFSKEQLAPANSRNLTNALNNLTTLYLTQQGLHHKVRFNFETYNLEELFPLFLFASVFAAFLFLLMLVFFPSYFFHVLLLDFILLIIPLLYYFYIQNFSQFSLRFYFDFSI